MRNARYLAPVGSLCGWLLLALLASTARSAEPAAAWSGVSPRDEIRPAFSFLSNGGRDGQGAWIIASDARQGLQGWWSHTQAVKGGQHYQFTAYRRADNVPTPRRSLLVRVLWQDSHGQPVQRDEPNETQLLAGERSLAEAEHPSDGAADAHGWTQVSGVYYVPRGATQATIELHLQWATNARVEWSQVSLVPCPAPASRKVRLAAVHLQPKGSTPAERCRAFDGVIAQAAAQQVDLLVLPETLTFYGAGGTMADVAESIPGPSTEYFGTLARKHNLYIVAGLVERDGHLIYNAAALVGPDGRLVGKYRKVTLPRGEIEAGVAPGNDYPVFETRFGKLGMMVCYDGFFPEVARELSNRGAEVIAWPVWGCNPLLAQARACENHVYLVSSTYTDVSLKWIITGIFDRQGRVVAQAKEWGTLAVAEVDLAKPTLWYNLGDFRAHMERHRPEVPAASRGGK